jgi:hypothetical protein
MSHELRTPLNGIIQLSDALVSLTGLRRLRLLRLQPADASALQSVARTWPPGIPQTVPLCRCVLWQVRGAGGEMNTKGQVSAARRRDVTATPRHCEEQSARAVGTSGIVEF